ncbi:MAG: hypothetical protein KA004_17365 [Verrucomicrobiales bacterium]|nr:hypothetical protein [Verrucomicrobiales bacterium]
MNWKFWTWFRPRLLTTAKPLTFIGDGRWTFFIQLDGDDAVMRPVQGRKLSATWFGGNTDPHDDGRTASGVMTRGNPDLLGCSLPMQVSNERKVIQCAGSPIVNVPWGTQVTVTVGNASLTMPLIDVGPARWTTDAIDLTRAAFTKFAPVRHGTFRVESVRIHGGAKFRYA